MILNTIVDVGVPENSIQHWQRRRVSSCGKVVQARLPTTADGRESEESVTSALQNRVVPWPSKEGQRGTYRNGQSRSHRQDLERLEWNSPRRLKRGSGERLQREARASDKFWDDQADIVAELHWRSKLREVLDVRRLLVRARHHCQPSKWRSTSERDCLFQVVVR